ncbi:trans-aconitate 2-methyltransferase [Cryobacterium sp. MLB-32]|uniref:class I SAM-dependent methyltransferase n=1 Tax=Cryobacterium sp. MLB-32 TaxID=1529318 RepID=UPI000562A806|nr:methyltransferase domain-containing protein [Cryobacterium sp. MLB-32]
MSDLDWTGYFDSQAGRRVRSLLVDTLARRGAAPPGTALDLGCGEGTETRHLLRNGWRVFAYDADPASEARVRAGLDAEQLSRLTFTASRFEDLGALPPAHLVYSSFALPFCSPEAFPGLWTSIRAALRPGAWFAGELFGPRDDWAHTPTMNFHDRVGVEGLVSGLEVASVVEDDRPGQSFGGPKHWHVFHISARRPS